MTKKKKTRTVKSIDKGKEKDAEKIGLKVGTVFTYSEKGGKCTRDVECSNISHGCKGGKCQ